MRKYRYVGLLLMTATMVHVGAAQTASDPQPEDAVRAILAAFDTYRVVAIGDHHQTRDLNDFVLSLVRHPAFPNAVNDIVIEGVNGLFQPVLDRYIAGEDVPVAEARKLWREGTNPAGVNDFHARLLQLVRRINQKLPPARRLRVLGGEAPVDWSNVTRENYPGNREEHIASVMEKEVLAKNRKALMFYGGAHVQHGYNSDAEQMAVPRYEKKYPGVTFVILPYIGGLSGRGCGLPSSANSTMHDSQMASWPVPSLVRTKGTWLADLKTVATQLSQDKQIAAGIRAEAGYGRVVNAGIDKLDAYLYLGPPDLLVAEPPSVFTFTDKDLLAEFHRRQIAIGQNGNDPRTDPDQVRELDSNVLKCEPAQR
jgi:hypothetical protein